MAGIGRTEPHGTSLIANVGLHALSAARGRTAGSRHLRSNRALAHQAEKIKCISRVRIWASGGHALDDAAVDDAFVSGANTIKSEEPCAQLAASSARLTNEICLLIV